MRAQHLLEAFTPAHSAALLEQLTTIVQILLHGEIPDEVAAFLVGASFFAAVKKNGGIRPIAVGETRLTAKCLCHLLKDKAAARRYRSVAAALVAQK